MTNVAEFEAGLLNGLLNVSVLVSVILRTTFVAFRNVQKLPPLSVAVDAGNMIELKEVFVT